MGRNNGFEQKHFRRQNERKRHGAESYAWGANDTKYTKQETRKRKIRVHIENEERKRTGRMNYAQSLQLLGNGSVFP